MLTYSLSDSCTVYIVLDGIGGAASGEVASKTAGQKVIEYLKEHFNLDGEAVNNIDNVSMAVKYANKCVYEMNKENKAYRDMGTTIAMLVVHNDLAYMVSVGDSRIYEIKEDGIYQLSEDDTYVNALVKDGIISEEEAKKHPDKHVLLKALGVTRAISFDVKRLYNVKERKFLLCSDGLTLGVNDEKIFEIIQQTSKENVCNKLVECANESGGLDNITVMYIEV